MEFHKKLQELRKKKGITQDELARDLYVSRTAISKWESGRGYPSIDSLKELSRYFSVSLDDLLSGDEIISMAEKDQQKNSQRLRDLVFGLLDCSTAILLFLPFFRQKIGAAIQGASLLSLEGVEHYTKITYVVVTLALISLGILTLSLQTYEIRVWTRYKHQISLGLSAVAALIFILSLQPYASMLVFLSMLIKVKTGMTRFVS